MRERILCGWLAVALTGPACASAGRSANASFPDPYSRIDALARLLVLEDGRTLGQGALLSFLQHQDPSIRRRAALAAGRIGDPLAAPALAALLGDPETEVRRTAALALGLLKRPESVAPLTTALADSDALTRGRAGEALGRIGDSNAGPAIATAFREALRSSERPLRIRGDDPSRADDPWAEMRLYLFALTRLKDAGSLARAVLEADGSPSVDWWAALWAAGRVPDRRFMPLFESGAAAEDPYVRLLAAKGLGALKDPAVLAFLKKLVDDRDVAVARQALQAIGAVGHDSGVSLVAPFVDSPNPTLRREALLALAVLPPAARVRPRVIENVGHPDPWVRAAAWAALIRIESDEVGLVLSTIGPDADWRVRAATAEAIANTLGEKGSPLLLPMLRDPEPKLLPAVLSAIVKARGADAAFTLRDYVKHPEMGVRVAVVEGLTSLTTKGDGRFVPMLNDALEAARDDGDIEVRMGIVEAFAKADVDLARAALRRIAGSDPSRAVRQAALDRLGEGFAPPETTSLRLADARRLVAVYEPGGAEFAPRAVLWTRHGRIEMTLDVVDTPLTTASFVRLAQSGFYNGVAFHRIVPGFVAQAGDPLGDGSGGPGFTVRCEYTGRPYGRGSVGMALAGKDTGGSQFFITLDPQPHLDGAYTHFGQVISGMDAAMQLRPGDIIERLEVFDGRSIP